MVRKKKTEKEKEKEKKIGRDDNGEVYNKVVEAKKGCKKEEAGTR